jgi:SIR2-like domain
MTTQAVWRAGDVYKVDLLDAAAEGYLELADEPARRWRSSIAREFRAAQVVFQGASAAVYRLGDKESALVPSHLRGITWEPFDEVYTPVALSSLIERENAAALEILISQLRSPMGVVPFVGAGLSVSFGFPSWQKFLTDASEFHSDPKSVIELITNGDYIGAAGRLFAESADRFQLMVAQAFGSKVSEEQARQGSVSLLPTLAKGPVITTNFDHVLETAFQAAGRPFDYVITGPQPDSVIRVMHRNELALIKIHGDAFDRSARVFTGSEYEAQYSATAGNPDSTPEGATVSKLARIMFTNRPLLFLGCSLDRDRTLDVLKTLHHEVRIV